MALYNVAPYTGAWIEITVSVDENGVVRVAPYTGAWIEIRGRRLNPCPLFVAPYTGAWIEITIRSYSWWLHLSHPTRVRGLKLFSTALFQQTKSVAPYTGAWIEI